MASASPEPKSSPDYTDYVNQTAALLGLTIPDAIHGGVVTQFERLVAIAQPVLTFELADTVEPAPTFDPLPPHLILNAPDSPPLTP
jgi:hypothetical protein